MGSNVVGSQAVGYLSQKLIPNPDNTQLRIHLLVHSGRQAQQPGDKPQFLLRWAEHVRADLRTQLGAKLGTKQKIHIREGCAHFPPTPRKRWSLHVSGMRRKHGVILGSETGNSIPRESHVRFPKGHVEVFHMSFNSRLQIPTDVFVSI